MLSRLAFRALLLLLPGEFRAGYASDMEATFRAERQAGGRGLALAALWIATAWDVLGASAREHAQLLARDVRYALRTLAARPAHSLAAVATLALAIGANVAMFAAVDAVLLAPLPYHEPDRLVNVAETSRGEAGNVGYLTFRDLRARARTFDALAAAGQSTATLAGEGRDAERVSAMRVSHGWFEMLGVRPVLGRTFAPSEDRPGAARRVAILSHRLWRDRYSSDPRVVGRPIDVAGTPHVVVGVLPSAFGDLVAARLYGGAELWFPLGYDEAASFACRTCRHLGIFGRLAPGVEPEDAERELTALLRGFAAEHPREYHEPGARVTSLARLFLGPVRPVLLVLGGGVLVLLLVACFNVAHLLLLRAGERGREIAVRTALGGTRGRLARQLATEALVLALASGLAGGLVAWAAVRLLAAFGPEQVPRLASASLDARALVVAIGLCAASAVLFGLAPLVRMLEPGPGALSGAGRRTAGRASSRARTLLVAGNVAMAGLLLIGSGLLVRSLAGLLATAPGFEPRGVLTLSIWLSGPRFREGENRDQILAAARFYDDVLARARALPGVTAASAVSTLPLGGGVDGYGLHVVGRPLENPEQAPSADRFVVAPQLFATLGIPLLRGRLLDERDGIDAEPVVIVNRTLAESLFAGRDPIGEAVRLGPSTAKARRIVGVVGDVRHHGLDVPVGLQVYVPQAQWAWAETALTVLVRGSGDASALAAPLRAIVRSADPAQAVSDVRLYSDVVAGSFGTRRFAAALLTAFAAAALTLSAVGLYGALGVFVALRREEIGVRLALGASAAAVRAMVLRQGMRPALGGIAAGLAAAALSAGTLRSQLHQVKPLDPWSFAAAACLLLACALAACALPAWRASRIDPAATLRSE